jgi:hypothetical protein
VSSGTPTVGCHLIIDCDNEQQVQETLGTDTQCRANLLLVARCIAAKIKIPAPEAALNDAGAAVATAMGTGNAQIIPGASLEQQAQTARQQFEQSQQTYATNKLEMDRKAKEVQEAADEERRKAASAEASALKARTRGGRRSLLSGERMDAELGVPINLGSSGMRLQ